MLKYRLGFYIKQTFKGSTRMADDTADKRAEELVFGIHEDDVPNPDWDAEMAAQLAREENIELTGEHFEVLEFLRQLYRDRENKIRHAREITEALEEQYESKGGLKYLYELFPNGPVNQGCKIAGLPAPKDSKNESFGSVT
jgi:tRNA 2-thiouridine synthesizing protein E